jgi:hypothetical protein
MAKGYQNITWRYLIMKALGKKISLIMGILAIGMLILVNPLRAGLVQEFSEETEIEIQDAQLLMIASNNSFLLYEGEELQNIIHDIPTFPTKTYSSLNDAVTDRELEIIYISGDDVLDSLDASGISTLSNLAKQGVFIGILGDGTHMREVLGITDADDYTTTDEEPINIIFFTYGKPDGCREDVFLSLENSPTIGQLFNSLFDWINDIREKHQELSSSDGAWDADYSHEWKGNMHGGSYRFLVNVYKLNTERTDYNWYLVDVSYHSAITDYKKSGGRCGWFTSAMNLEANVDSSNGASLYEYMPTGTISNTTTRFTIGANLSASPGLTASYSQSYSTPDVTIEDKSNYMTNTAKWDLSFVGPDYKWYPFYEQPCNVARHSYETQPTFIVQVPKNQKMKVNLHPYIKHENDSLTFCVVYLKVKKEWQYWTSSTLTINVGP